MKKSYFVLFLILLTGFNLTKVQGNYSVYITIDNAYYADLDNDTLLDDISLTVTIEIYNYYYSTDTDLYIGVELPSGAEFWFFAQFTFVKSSYYGITQIQFDLLNTALESGWYWAHAVGYAAGEKFSLMDSFTFDPPGSTQADPPIAYYSFI